MKMFQVDAFADELFTGNPAAVLLLDDWLPDTLMRAIAAENNLAETAFAKAAADGAYDLRWFAPRHEVDFCGHATLATAHVLFTTTDVQAPLVFRTRVGTLQVAQVPGGYQLDLPALLPETLEALPSGFDGMLTTPPAALFRNFENLFADLGDADSVRRFTPDLAVIDRLGPIGFAVTGRESEGLRADFVSRYFAPGSGIPEDPVTGSIHATLVPYWAQRLGRSRLTAFQASPRGGWLECAWADGRVRLTGNAVTFMEATLSLPGVQCRARPGAG